MRTKYLLTYLLTTKVAVNVHSSGAMSMGSLLGNQKKVGTLPLTLPLTLLGNQKKVSTLTLILTLVLP